MGDHPGEQGRPEDSNFLSNILYSAGTGTSNHTSLGLLLDDAARARPHLTLTVPTVWARQVRVTQSGGADKLRDFGGSYCPIKGDEKITRARCGMEDRPQAS